MACHLIRQLSSTKCVVARWISWLTSITRRPCFLARHKQRIFKLFIQADVIFSVISIGYTAYLLDMFHWRQSDAEHILEGDICLVILSCRHNHKHHGMFFSPSLRRIDSRIVNNKTFLWRSSWQGGTLCISSQRLRLHGRWRGLPAIFFLIYKAGAGHDCGHQWPVLGTPEILNCYKWFCTILSLENYVMWKMYLETVSWPPLPVAYQTLQLAVLC